METEQFEYMELDFEYNISKVREIHIKIVEVGRIILYEFLLTHMKL